MSDDDIELEYELSPELQLKAAYGWSAHEGERGLPKFTFAQVIIWLLMFGSILAGLQNWVPKNVAFGFLLGLAVSALVNMVTCLVGNQKIKALYGLRAQDTMRVLLKLSPQGFSTDDPLVTSRYSWPAVDAIVKLKDASGIRMGASTIAVPNTALPADLSPVAFRNKLREWMKAQ